MSEAAPTWNPKALSEHQQLALRMAAWGVSAREISRVSGYSREHVYRLLATEAGQEARRSYRQSIEHTIESTVRELVPEALTAISD